MRPETIMEICDAIDTAGQMLAATSVAIFAAVAAGVLIPVFSIWLGGRIWRFLRVRGWNSAIVSAERKALR
jgi:hypothetical protein